MEITKFPQFMKPVRSHPIGVGVLALMLAQFASADVTTTTSGFEGKTVVTFTGAGSTTWTVPADVTSIDLLVVAGGGPGGQGGGGGGGAGGLLYYQNQPVTPLDSQVVVVGAGGIGGTSGNPVWTVGENSSFLGFTAIGGGRRRYRGETASAGCHPRQAAGALRSQRGLSGGRPGGPRQRSDADQLHPHSGRSVREG